MTTSKRNQTGKNGTRKGGESLMREAIERDERAHLRMRRQLIAVTVGSVIVMAIALGVFLAPKKGTAAGERIAPRTGPKVVSAAASAAPEVEPVVEPEPDPAPVEARAKVAETDDKKAAREYRIDIGDYGYEPAVVNAPAGAPIRLIVEKGEGCAAGFLIPELGIEADNTSGPATIDLGTPRAGTYRFTCGMEMVEGKLVVR